MANGALFFGLSGVIALASCAQMRERKIERIVDGLVLVCASRLADFADCARGKPPMGIQANRHNVFDVPNTELFEHSWEVLEQRIRSEGFDILERPGPGPVGFYSIYVGGPLYTIKFRDRSGTYILSTTIVSSIRRSSSEFSQWRPENVVLTVP